MDDFIFVQVNKEDSQKSTGQVTLKWLLSSKPALSNRLKSLLESDRNLGLSEKEDCDKIVLHLKKNNSSTALIILLVIL